MGEQLLRPRLVVRTADATALEPDTACALAPDQLVLNAGGPVMAVEWCPTPPGASNWMMTAATTKIMNARNPEDGKESLDLTIGMVR